MNDKNITIPPELSLTSSEFQQSTLEVLNEIKRISSTTKSQITIDMTTNITISAQCALLLFAYITNIQIQSNNSNIFTIKRPIDKEANIRLARSGLWRAIRPGSKRKLAKMWQTDNNFQSGTEPDKQIELILDSLNAKSKIPPRLSQAITETILNIKHHAYEDIENLRWWHYIYINNGKLTFLIYDNGMGIAKKFRKNIFDKLKQDSELIKKAMQTGVTSTKIAGRGNGSSDIRKPINRVENGKLMVVSHSGVYTYTIENGERLFEIKPAIAGTLVSWQFEV